MKNNKLLLAGILTFTVLSAIVTTTNANNYSLNWWTGQKVNSSKWKIEKEDWTDDKWKVEKEDKNEKEGWKFENKWIWMANQKARQDAITNNDYNAYLTAIKGTNMEGKVTQSQFDAKVVKMQKEKAREQIETAKKTAITNNDYNAYLTAIKGTKMEGKVTQAQFDKIVARQKK